MIIDSPSIIAMALGTDRRVPQEGDAQVVLPSIVFPTVVTMSPTEISGSGALVHQTSFILEAVITATNAADTTVLVCTLGKGLWILQMHLNSQFNYTKGVPALTGTAIILGYQGQIPGLMGREPFIGSFVDVRDIQLLLTETATLSIRNGLNGVGQTTDASFQLNAIRQL